MVVLNEDKAQTVRMESPFSPVWAPNVRSLPATPGKGHSHP